MLHELSSPYGEDRETIQKKKIKKMSIFHHFILYCTNNVKCIVSYKESMYVT